MPLSLQLIESSMKITLPEDLVDGLSDGVILCNLVNQLRPNTIAVIYTPPHRARNSGVDSGKVLLITRLCDEHFFYFDYTLQQANNFSTSSATSKYYHDNTAVLYQGSISCQEGGERGYLCECVNS